VRLCFNIPVLKANAQAIFQKISQVNFPGKFGQKSTGAAPHDLRLVTGK